MRAPATSCRHQTGLAYSITNNSGSTYTWSITNGVIQSGQNTNSVSVKWFAPGTGTIYATEMNSVGCDSTVQKTITIYGRPIPTVSGATSVCQYTTGNSYTVTAVSGDTYNW